jgi:nucleotide-binding universal stress UspA family protein
MVGVDGGPASEDAIAVARRLAAPDARLALAHVYVLTPVRGGSGAYGVPENAEAVALLQRVRETAGVAADLLPLTASSVGRGLHYLAETNDADLLCVGSNPRSLVGRVLIGDATRASLIGAPCAVAVAPLEYSLADAAIARIGVGYDGSPEADMALACARDLAAGHGAAVTALTVVEPAGYPMPGRRETQEREVEAARAELTALEGVEGEVRVGVAGEELEAFAADVDLLVIGSRGYGPLRRLMLGSTATHLAGNARCPLLVLPRADGAE